MTAYTVQLGEPDKTGKYYVGSDLRVRRTTRTCKRLSFTEAEEVKERFLAAAKREGWPITVKIIRLR